MATNCAKCGAVLDGGHHVCGVSAVPGSQRADLAQPRNLARIAQVVALVGFVLPWITVSCQGRVLAEVSGLDMALGRATVHNPFTNVSQVHSGAPNAMVVVALVLIVAGLALSFNVAAVRVALANVVASAAALLLIGYAVLVSAGGAVRSQAASSQAPDGGLERSLSEAVKVGTGFGFWITCIALAAAIFFYWKLRSAGDAAAIRAASPPPEAQVRTNRAGSDPAPGA